MSKATGLRVTPCYDRICVLFLCQGDSNSELWIYSELYTYRRDTDGHKGTDAGHAESAWACFTHLKGLPDRSDEIRP